MTLPVLFALWKNSPLRSRCPRRQLLKRLRGIPEAMGLLLAGSMEKTRNVAARYRVKAQKELARFGGPSQKEMLSFWLDKTLMRRS